MPVIEDFLLKLNSEYRKGFVEFTGNNDHPEIEKYLKKCRVPLFSAWCAAFLYWCATSVGIGPKKLPAISGSCNPAAVRCWAAWSKSKGLDESSPANLKRGDLGYWLNANQKGHIFAIVEVKNIKLLSMIAGLPIVSKFMPDSVGWWIRTYEGNGSDDPNDRNGSRIVMRWRRCTSKLRYIRFREYISGLEASGGLE